MSQRLTLGLRPFAASFIAFVVLASAVALPAAAAEPASQGRDPATQAGVYPFKDGVFRTPPGVSFAPDRLLVKFRAGAPAATQLTARQSVNATVERAFQLVPGLQVLSLRGGRATDVVAAAAALSRRPDVEYAMPDFAYQLTLEPDDSDYSGQWALPIIGAPAAWARSTGSSTVTVAVLDTGVDLDHPDLAANLVPGWNFVADNDNPNDDHGHGTHVAGIIGAVGNNATGVSGVNWSVSLMPLKICDEYGSCYLSAEIAALEFAVAHGARVANASFGAANGGWEPERDAIAAAGSAGVIFVAAAGNQASNNDANPFYPASYPLDNVIAVGASTSSDTLAGFSNYGKTEVDLVAPGDMILSTYPDGYQYLSGTSMAAPQVAGAAALVKSLHPNWTAQKVRRQLIGSATPISGLEGKAASCGRLNLDAATNPATVLKFALCVTRRGTGLGSVTSSSAAIDCGATCAALVAKNTPITLTATPALGSSFAGWNGACTGTGSCVLPMAAATTVGATFIDPASQGGWKNSLLTPPSGRDPLPPGSGAGRYSSFFNVTLSANGKVRAKTLYTQPDGWCYYASTDTGGIFIERKTSSGWVADGTITTPVPGPQPSDRWMNCSGFGSVAQLSADGKSLLVSQESSFTWPGVYRCSAFVYRRTAAGWQLDGSLFPAGVTYQGVPDYAPCGLFGRAGAISATGDRVAIYAPYPVASRAEDWHPRVDVFVRSSSGWSLEKTIVAPNGPECGRVVLKQGFAMSADGARILLGDPSCNANVGRVYHYQRAGSVWTKKTNVTSPSTGRWFGGTVAISADGLTATMGVNQQPGQSGSVTSSWVFELSAGTWLSRRRLEPGVADPEASFSCTAIVKAGKRIVCSASDNHGFNEGQGSIYVFNRPATGWSAGAKRTRLFAPLGYAFDRIGAADQYWYASPAVREDGKLIDATVTALSLALGEYRDRIGYEFRP